LIHFIIIKNIIQQ